MPEDRTVLTADASQYFDVLSRAGVAADRLGASGARVGEGFLRGERAARVASRNISTGLLSVQDAGSGALVVMQGLERVFKLGFGPTIGIVGLITGVEFLHSKTKELLDTYGKLRDELARPLATGSAEAIALQIESLSKATDELIRKQQTLSSRIVGAIIASQPGGAGGRKDIQEAIEASQRRLNQLEDERANKELLAAKIRAESNEIAKAELVFEDKRNALLDEFIKKGGNVLNFYKRELAAEIDLESAKRKEQDANEKKLATLKDQTAEAEKQAKLAKDAASRTPGQQASERRQIRAENRREKELRNELSREGDPDKRADIQDELEEIAQARRDRAQRAEQQQRAQNATKRAAAEARAREDAERFRQAQQAQDEAQKKQDEAELTKFGRILRPEERLSERLKDEEAARQKKFQDDEEARQQGFRDRQEAESRGISVDQLKREREFKRRRGDQTNADNQDFSGVAALANKDFSSLASLATYDFSGLASLNGLHISIA